MAADEQESRDSVIEPLLQLKWLSNTLMSCTIIGEGSMGTNVRLPARLERLVSRVAKERGATKSEVIRNVLAMLEEEGQKARGGATPYQAMKHLIGCASGGPSDLSAEPGKKFRGMLLRRRIVR